MVPTKNNYVKVYFRVWHEFPVVHIKCYPQRMTHSSKSRGTVAMSVVRHQTNQTNSLHVQRNILPECVHIIRFHWRHMETRRTEFRQHQCQIIRSERKAYPISATLIGVHQLIWIFISQKRFRNRAPHFWCVENRVLDYNFDGGITIEFIDKESRCCDHRWSKIVGVWVMETILSWIQLGITNEWIQNK